MITVILEINGEEYVRKPYIDRNVSQAYNYASGLKKTYSKFLVGKEFRIYIERLGRPPRKVTCVNMRPCIQMDMYGSFVAEHESIKEAARVVDARPSAIIRAFGRTKGGTPHTCMGYRWKLK